MAFKVLLFSERCRSIYILFSSFNKGHDRWSLPISRRFPSFVVLNSALWSSWLLLLICLIVHFGRLRSHLFMSLSASVGLWLSVMQVALSFLHSIAVRQIWSLLEVVSFWCYHGFLLKVWWLLIQIESLSISTAAFTNVSNAILTNTLSMIELLLIIAGCDCDLLLRVISMAATMLKTGYRSQAFFSTTRRSCPRFRYSALICCMWSFLKPFTLNQADICRHWKLRAIFVLHGQKLLRILWALWLSR